MPLCKTITADSTVCQSVPLCKTIMADSTVCQSVPLCKTIMADSTVCQSVPLCKTIMADSTVSLHYHNTIVQELIDVLYSRLTVQLASFGIAFFNRQNYCRNKYNSWNY